MKFCDRLLETVQPVWEMSHNHPFVVGMGDGTLEKDKFQYYIIQDYLYLLDYAKLYAMVLCFCQFYLSSTYLF